MSPPGAVPFAVALVVGILTEMIAKRAGWWEYETSATPVFNIFVMFGLIQGAFIAGLSGLSLPMQFLAGAAVGTAYEIANARLLHWWTFPSGRVLFLKGEAAIIAGIGLAWGFIPVMVSLVAAAIA